MSKINKLIKNIENFNTLKKIQIKNEKMIIEASLMNNRINNMIRVMKKMILNVNTFMQKIVNRIQYFALFFSIQIMKRFETKTFVAILQAQIISSMQFIQRFDFFYQNNQFMNFELYQRFLKNDFSKFTNDKYLYCFRNDHIFKKIVFFFRKILRRSVFILLIDEFFWNRNVQKLFKCVCEWNVISVNALNFSKNFSISSIRLHSFLRLILSLFLLFRLFSSSLKE